VARGYWQGPVDDIAARPAGSASGQNGTVVASADAGVTGSIGALPAADSDHAAPALALGYAADQPAHDAPTGIAALRAAAAPIAHAAANETTIAVKRAANQVASAVMTATASSVAVIKAGAQVESPWLRAVVLSPSVRHFLTTAAIGVRDFRSLAALMVKPSNSVVMTFAAEPNPGLEQDHFSGAAIVFVSTVSYQLRTAALQ
jgi:hypothetical protein